MAVRMARRSVFARSWFAFGGIQADTVLGGPPATRTGTSHRSYGNNHPNEEQQQQQEQHIKNRRISRNLYRELLRWCQTQTNHLKYPDSVLEYMGIPPVSFSAPEDVDAFRLELLFKAYHHDSNSNSNNHNNNVDARIAQKALQMLPPKCDLTRQQLVAPVLSFSGLRGLLRAVFRLNHVEPPMPLEDSVAYENLMGYEKKRRTAAFHALKSFNELKLADKLNPQRWDRNGVTVRIGQIVQHRQERWRGVVVEWNKEPSSARHGRGRRAASAAGTSTLSDDFSTLTTLTTKKYSLTMEESDNDDKDTNPTEAADATSRVRCTVLLDMGDAVTHNAPLTSTVPQSELDPVTDPQLCRIRSLQTQQYFVRYNAKANRFVPNPLLAYQYPSDDQDSDSLDGTLDANEKTSSKQKEPSSEYDTICEEIAVGVQEFAAHLNTLLLESAVMANNSDNKSNIDGSTLDDSEPASFNGTAYDLLAGTQRNLHAMVKGDVLPTPLRFQSNVLPATIASLHLKALSEFSQGLMEIMDHRRQTIQTKNSQFTVGDIVRHKKYGFRGVVLAWDPTPVTDVSRWDGLQDIVDPHAQPFYHILPDQNDCRDVFGGERPMRYVCQENLELLVNAEDVAGMEIENVDSDWHWQPDCRRYMAPAMVRFKHGQDLGDHGALERCLERLEDAINEWQFKSRQVDFVTDGDVTIRKLSMRNIMQLLHAVDNVADAAVVEELIKEMRKAHPNKNLRSLMEQGLASLVAGRANDGLDIYESVLEQDPNYAEAWNKLATAEFMMGMSKKSLESAEKALQLDPLHFQAHNTIGLLLFEKGEFQAAEECFRKTLERNPWSPVSSRISECGE